MLTKVLHFTLLGAVVLPLVYGQSDASRIVGVVSDASGAVIPGASVTVKNERTGEARRVTTDEHGLFLAAQLSPSSYSVTAEAKGMANAEFTGVNLQVGQVRTFDIKLQPSSVTTEVSVSGGSLAVIETSSASIGANVSAREVEQLPINGRQVSQLYLMAPGATNFGSGTFDDIRFNGRSNEENALRIDGVEGGGIISNNPGNFNGEVTGVFRLQSSLENVQEFRVEVPSERCYGCAQFLRRRQSFGTAAESIRRLRGRSHRQGQSVLFRGLRRNAAADLFSVCGDHA